MKSIICFLCLVMPAACKQQADHTHHLQAQIDSLQNKLDNNRKSPIVPYCSWRHRVCFFIS